jgi:ABC-type transport system involved in multi-copper enzyme maturation permease subunit
MSWTRIYALALNTAREALRSRAGIGLLLVAVLFVIFSLALSALAIREDAARVVIDFGLFSFGLFGVLTAVVMGTILVHKEVDRKTIFTIVSKPVHRHEIIVGKYLGMMVNLTAVLLVLAIVWALVLWLRRADVGAEAAKAVLLLWMELLVVSAMALFFASFTSPVLSGLFTLGFFLLGRTVGAVDLMLDSPRSIFADLPALKPLGNLYVHTVPDLSVFQVSQEILLGVEVSGGYLVASFGYAVAYAILFLAAAIVLFRRRDFV